MRTKNYRGKQILEITKALIIDEPWISKILDGEKEWEMRSKKAGYRGTFGLIKKGSGQVFGIATLSDVSGPYSNLQLSQYIDHHRVGPEVFMADDYNWRFAWHLRDIKKLETPVRYQHKNGAVTWVNLNPEAVADLGEIKIFAQS